MNHVNAPRREFLSGLNDSGNLILAQCSFSDFDRIHRSGQGMQAVINLIRVGFKREIPYFLCLGLFPRHLEGERRFPGAWTPSQDHQVSQSGQNCFVQFGESPGDIGHFFVLPEKELQVPLFGRDHPKCGSLYDNLISLLNEVLCLLGTLAACQCQPQGLHFGNLCLLHQEIKISAAVGCGWRELHDLENQVGVLLPGNPTDSHRVNGTSLLVQPFRCGKQGFVFPGVLLLPGAKENLPRTLVCIQQQRADHAQLCIQVRGGFLFLRHNRYAPFGRVCSGCGSGSCGGVLCSSSQRRCLSHRQA